MSISLKCQHGGVWRRMNIEPMVSFELLERTLRKSFGLPDDLSLRLFYLDDEEDQVAFSTKDEYDEAIRIHRKSAVEGPLKIILQNANPAQPTPVALQPEAVKSEPKIPSSNCVHFRVRCDSCGTVPIRGTRFKCVMCEDYDLCEQCEASDKTSHSHATTHAMLKLRLPLDITTDWAPERPPPEERIPAPIISEVQTFDHHAADTHTGEHDSTVEESWRPEESDEFLMNEEPADTEQGTTEARDVSLTSECVEPQPRRTESKPSPSHFTVATLLADAAELTERVMKMDLQSGEGNELDKSNEAQSQTQANFQYSCTAPEMLDTRSQAYLPWRSAPRSFGVSRVSVDSSPSQSVSSNISSFTSQPPTTVLYPPISSPTHISSPGPSSLQNSAETSFPYSPLDSANHSELGSETVEDLAHSHSTLEDSFEQDGSAMVEQSGTCEDLQESVEDCLGDDDAECPERPVIRADVLPADSEWVLTESVQASSSHKPNALDSLDLWEEANRELVSMGFADALRNQQLLIEHEGDITRVVDVLLASS